MNTKEQLKLLLKEIVIDLVNENYERIQRRLIEELKVDDVKEELSCWGLLTIPSDAAFEKINFIEYEDGSGYAMEFELWIDNQESDLTLSCEAMVDDIGNVHSFLINNLHVL